MLLQGYFLLCGYLFGLSLTQRTAGEEYTVPGNISNFNEWLDNHIKEKTGGSTQGSLQKGDTLSQYNSEDGSGEYEGGQIREPVGSNISISNSILPGQPASSEDVTPWAQRNTSHPEAGESTDIGEDELIPVDTTAGESHTKPGTNLDASPPKNETCLKVYPGSRQSLGMEFPRHTERSCISLCFGLRECAAAEFDRFYNTCRIHQWTSAISHHHDPCCMHYKRNPCPADIGNDIHERIIPADSTSDSDSPKGCDRERAAMVKTPNLSQYGGMKQTKPSQMTEEQCVTRCLEDTACTAVDYNKHEPSCWLHVSHSTKPRFEKTTCCSHYEKNKTCENDCFTVYQYNRVNRIALTRTVGITLNDCKQQCLEDSECSAFNYNTDEVYCLMYHDTSHLDGMIQSDRCCSVWIKQTCNGHRNDTLILNEIYRPTTSSTAASTPAITTTTSTVSITSRSTTTRRAINDFTIPTIPEYTAPTDVESSEGNEGGFWMSTSSIIVIAGCVFVFVVALIGLIAFAAHRRKERRKMENEALNPTNPRNWIIKHPHGESGGSSLLAFWQSELHPDRRSETCSFPSRHAASLPPNRPAELELLPIQRSRAHSAHVSEPQHVHLSEVGHVKRVSQPYCTHIRQPTYPDQSHLSGLHSPKRLTRYDATSINNNDTLYLEEFGDTDKFYRGGDIDKHARPHSVASVYP